MKILKKIILTTMVFSFLTMSATRAHAEDETLKDMLSGSIYGGIIGALVGSGAMLLTDKPEDNLSYIVTGAGLGILVGTAYSIATSGVVQSVGEIEDGKFTLKVPTVRMEKIYDPATDSHELVERVDLIKLRF